MNLELSAKAREIVACAKALLAVGGYHSFSYADISAAVKISKPSIHHHFPSKAELVETVVAVYREETRAGLAQLERHMSGPFEQLQGYTNFWAACVRDRETSFCVCAMLATEMPTLPPKLPPRCVAISRMCPSGSRRSSVEALRKESSHCKEAHGQRRWRYWVQSMEPCCLLALTTTPTSSLRS